MKENGEKIYHTQIIGAGPAGLGIPVAADRIGVWTELLDKGLAIVDKNDHIGCGSLDSIQAKSNSQALEFLDAISTTGSFAEVLESRSAQDIVSYGHAIIPLQYVVTFLDELGNMVEDQVTESTSSAFLSNHTVDHIRQQIHSDSETVIFSSIDRDGNTIASSEHVVLATGAVEEAMDLGTWELNQKRFTSREILADEHEKEIAGRLDNPRHKVVIIGASHSAFAAAARLLEKYDEDAAFTEGDISIYYRGEIKTFYDTTEEAEADKYAYTDENICPKTGRVNRFSGIRGDAKSLFRAIISGNEKRVILKRLQGEIRDIGELGEAALIIQALGYKARVIPIFDAENELIGPKVSPKGKVEVDDSSRVIGEDGSIIPHVYAIGIGHGVKATEEIGGEASAAHHPVDAINFFHGKIGEQIIYQLLRPQDKPSVNGYYNVEKESRVSPYADEISRRSSAERKGRRRMPEIPERSEGG